MARHDRAIPVFSPDGHLFQVEYALEAFRKGNTAVGVRGTDDVVLGVEQKIPVRKIVSQDDHIALACPVDYITRYIAGLQQKYTQNGGADPSVSACKANVTVRNSNSMREFLEKNYKETSGQETVKLAIRALLEVVESGGKNIEVAVMTKENGLCQLKDSEIDAIVAEIEAEKGAAEAAKKAPPRET